MIEKNDNLDGKVYYEYAKDVLFGKIVAGEYIKLACQRFMNDLEREDLIFRPSKVRHVCKFIYQLRHFTGEFAGQHFTLLPWQAWVIANIFGFYKWQTNDATGEKRLLRRFRYADIDVARKTGKSSLVSAICLYCLLADGENDPCIDLAATTRQQAGVIYKMSCQYLKSIDEFGKYTHVLRNSIELKGKPGILKILSSDSQHLDGGNSS